MARRVRVYASGRVQGVCYRDFVRTTAERLCLGGWVRNLSDGRVEAIVEGDEGKINDLINFMKLGPSKAFVESVEVFEEKPQCEFCKFFIKYNYR